MIALGMLSGLLGTTPAGALPPGGASPDTPGTSSHVWPTTLQVGGTIHFEVTGFPAGQTVYIKIDDGTDYSDQTIQGAGVVAAQKIGSNGVASGSFELPAFVQPGAHWLRYLASEPIMKDGQQVGVLGFSRRGGSDFTVVAAPSAAPKTTAHTGGQASTRPRTSAPAAPRSTARVTPPGSAAGNGTTTARPPAAQPGATQPDAAQPGAAGTDPADPGQGQQQPIGAGPATDPSSPAGTGGTAAGSAASTRSSAGATTSARTGPAAPSQGGVVRISGGANDTVATASTDPGPAAAGPSDPSTAEVVPVAAAGPDGGAGFPWVGATVLGVVVLLIAVGGVLLLRRPGNRAAGATSTRP